MIKTLYKIRLAIITAVFGAILAGCGGPPPEVQIIQNPDYHTGLRALKKGDYAAAISHLKPFAQQGNSQAQFIMGYIHGDISGKFVDLDKSFYWYNKSARQGHSTAQNNMGSFYWRGQGNFKKDYALAYMWWTVAKINGEEAAAENIDRVTQYLSSSEIIDGQRKAQHCIDTDYKICE